MPIEVKMPAASPTMEKGTLAKWLVKEGDVVKLGDLIAEIETDKATMEFEAVDEGRITKIVVPEGADDIAVGAVIALMGEAAGGDVLPPTAPAETQEQRAAIAASITPVGSDLGESMQPSARTEPLRPTMRMRPADKAKVSPLAARISKAKAINLSHIVGTGLGGRIVKADLGLSMPQHLAPTGPIVVVDATVAAPPTHAIPDVPHESVKLSNMRRTIARRLTESKQTVPHIYLTVDITLDPLLALRVELNDALASQGTKISINDMVIKALALALVEVPVCNVQFAGDQLIRFQRADISVAVSIPNGLITPVIVEADRKSPSTISREMKDLAGRAREGKLQPVDYQGGTASLSNLGMFGIRQFGAVINPPQAMIMAVGASEKNPVVCGDTIEMTTVLTATGSFDHRAIDGADAALLMQAFRRLLENPLEIVA